MIPLEMKQIANKMKELMIHMKTLYFQRMTQQAQYSILNIDKIKKSNIKVLNPFLKKMLNLKKILKKVIMLLLKDINLHKFETSIKKMIKK